MPAKRPIEAKDKFTAFAKKHPIATLAGGLAVGILVSGLFGGSPTRKAGKKLGKSAAGLAALATELAVAYAQSAMEATADTRSRRGKAWHVERGSGRLCRQRWRKCTRHR